MPLLGKYDVPELIPAKPVVEESVGDTLSYDELPGTAWKIQPFHLFGKADNISRNALLFYHESAFDTADNPLHALIAVRSFLFVIHSFVSFRFSDFQDG